MMLFTACHFFLNLILIITKLNTFLSQKLQNLGHFLLNLQTVYEDSLYIHVLY